MKKAGVNVGRYNMLNMRHTTDRADWILAEAEQPEQPFSRRELTRTLAPTGRRLHTL
ncbi:MAG: hypothetical protein OXC00_05120 [Acidimicrobiaceae bacterium]|nr:hypothetical protein [Acidimicrobiaceae bacterium]